MKKLPAVLIATALCLPVPVRAVWSTLGPSECTSYVRDQGRLEKCLSGLIDAINELAELKQQISHERQMRGYMDVQLQYLRTDVEKLERLVKTLTFETEDLRAKLSKSK